jgi:hypothetical protein
MFITSAQSTLERRTWFHETCSIIFYGFKPIKDREPVRSDLRIRPARLSDCGTSKAEREPDLPQDDERGVGVPTIVKMFVKQRDNRHSHRCIEAPFNHALRVPAIRKACVRRSGIEHQKSKGARRNRLPA